jgi:hypothetical protein
MAGACGVVTLIVFVCCAAPAAASTTVFGADAGSGKFNDIAVGPSGNVYALDTADHVVEFSYTRTLLGTGSGTAPVQLHTAYSSAVDPSGNVFVATFQLTAKGKSHKQLHLRMLDRAGNAGAWRKLHV